MSSSALVPASSAASGRAVASPAVASATNRRWDAEKKKRTRGRLGAAQDFEKMPLEIIYIIYGYLLPKDLLRMSRTTKTLRAFVMSRRSARTLWVQVFRNLNTPLPECPDDLNEPQYAHLAFDHDCEFCGHRTPQVIWSLRTRSCKSCVNNRSLFVIGSYPSTDSSYPSTDSDPRLPISVSGILVSTSTGGSSYGSSLYLKTDMDALKAEITKYPISLSDITTQRRMRLEKIEAHARQCVQWEQDVLSERRQERWALIQKREQSIRDKLREMDMGAHLEALEWRRPRAFTRHKLVKKPQKLTEKAWEKIREPLVDFILEANIEDTAPTAEGLDDAFDQTMSFDAFEEDSLGAFQPPLQIPTADVIDVDEFDDWVQQTIATPNGNGEWGSRVSQSLLTEVVQETALEVVQQEEAAAEIALSPFEREWHSRLGTTLRGLLPFPVHVPLLDALRRPLAFFECLHPAAASGHGCLLTPQRAANHRHLRNTSALGTHVYSPCSEAPSGSASGDCAYVGLSSAGPDAMLAFHREASMIAWELIAMCDLDPTTETFKNVHKVDARFACEACSSPTEGRLVMSWIVAIEHTLTQHDFDHAACRWSRVALEEVADVRRLEAKLTSVGSGEGPFHDRCCAMCCAPLAGMQHAQEHLEENHPDLHSASLDDIWNHTKEDLDVLGGPPPVRLPPAIHIDDEDID